MKHRKNLLCWTLVFASLMSAFPASAIMTNDVNAETEVIDADGLLEESNPDDAFFALDDYECLLDNSTLGNGDVLENCSSKQDIISSIISENVFTMDGVIVTDSGRYDVVDYYDFAELNKFEIADWAYKSNLISEEEKIDCYCDLILEQNFCNISCLTCIIDEIQSYIMEKNLSDELDSKIEKVLAEPFSERSNSVSILSISNEATYDSENFTIHYDSSRPNERADAIEVANFYEQVRSQFITWGFRTPELQWFKNKYQVYLDPGTGSDPSVTGLTKYSASTSNTCASYITIYYFDLLDESIKAVIVHEYFHAIQCAYNKQTGWFTEACASWAPIVYGNYTYFDGAITRFIDGSNSTSMSDTSGYGAAIFVLTLHKLYGGVNVIRKIYEEYNDHSSNIDLAELRTVITTGIRNNGYSNGSFGDAYRRMAIDVCDTQTNYESEFPVAKNWTSKEKDGTITIAQNTMYQRKTTSGSLNNLTSKYYKIVIPASYKGSIKFYVNFGGSGCYAQVYYKRTDGKSDYYRMLYSNSIILDDIGDGISEVTLILSNIYNSDTSNFSVETSFIPRYEIAANARYTEYAGQLEAGQVAECIIKFSTGGSKVFQTFGTMDTYLFLLTRDDRTYLASSDNEGYDKNAFMRYEVTANTEYILQVHNASGKAGSTKLAISPTTWLIDPSSTTDSIEKFSDIWSVTGKTSYTLGTSTTLNSTKVIAFTPPVSGDYTIQTVGSRDTYIYVVDPRSATRLLTYEYDDNSGTGNNALVEKYMDANVPYLIFYSGKNIQDSSMAGSIQLKIVKD